VRGRGEREVARIAAIQKGFATREQLLAAGLGRGAIVHRLGTGRLRERYRGVYLVDRARVEPLGEEMAAVLHFGGYAVLTHRSAAFVWELLRTAPPFLTLTMVGKHGRPRHGLRLHRLPLDRREIRVRDGLPVTSPARTLLDLAGEMDDAELEEGVAVARQRRFASADEVRVAISRTPGRKGASRLARLLDAGAASGFTRSTAERRMRELLRAAELPQPQANAPLLGYVADFLWAEHRLVVEVDGYQFHSDRGAFERDRRRDQVFAAAGYTVVRVTWAQLSNEPLAVVARIAQALAARAA
jgi:very-short-patch-repair endonuclease